MKALIVQAEVDICPVHAAETVPADHGVS